MRFIFVTQTFPPAIGGMQFVMAALARLLAVRVPVNVYPDFRYASGDYQVYCLPMVKLLRPTIKRWRLSWALRSDDVIICDSWKSLQAVPEIARTVVVLAHGQEFLFTREAKARRVRRLMAKATHVIASSNATLALVASVMDLTAHRAAVIPPTYGLSPCALVPKQKGACFQLLSICRLEQRKGLHYVLDVLGRQRHWPDFYWRIIGEGVEKDALARKIEAYDLSDRVQLCGQVSDAEKQSMLEHADLFVMPSYQESRSLEGYGIAYIEAARCGVASIAGVAGGVKDAVRDRFTGWCVDPRDHDALSQVLYEALHNRERCRQYGFNAYQYFHEHLTSSQVLGRFLQHVLTSEQLSLLDQ